MRTTFQKTESAQEENLRQYFNSHVANQDDFNLKDAVRSHQ